MPKDGIRSVLALLHSNVEVVVVQVSVYRRRRSAWSPPSGSAPLHGSSSRVDTHPTDIPKSYEISQRTKITKKNQIHSYMVVNLWL